MANRKQFSTTRVADPRLESLMVSARDRGVTDAELREQRISFAFGNAPHSSDGITKDSVRESSKRLSVTNK